MHTLMTWRRSATSETVESDKKEPTVIRLKGTRESGEMIKKLEKVVEVTPLTLI